VSEEFQHGGNSGGQAKGVSGAVVAAIVAGVLFLIILFVAITSVTTYNGLVDRVEAADEAWGQVEDAYQRRADLVPNLVDSVERFMEHERETLESVADAREGESLSQQLEALKAARQSASESDQTTRASAPTRVETLAKLKGSQQQLSERMTALMARVEAYPQLRSSDQFMRLQSQLEGAENRISVARQRYNQAVSDLNSALQRIPGRWIAQLAGFEQRAYFEADNGAAEAPSVAE